MKMFIIILGIVVVAGLAVVLLGDRLIRSRFDLGTYSYVTSEMAGVTNEISIRTGLGWALDQAKLDTNAWVIPPSTNWEHNAGGNRVVIMLSNQVDGMRLFAHVEPVNGQTALRYELSRGK